MEVAITKLSENGQVVIPAEVRRDAGLKVSTKFLVFNEGGNIFLKVINKDELMKKIKKSEEEIKKGHFVKADTSNSDEDIDNLLMK